MWQLANHTPFAAARAWTRDIKGMEVWLVAVKCTFDIQQDGHLEVADEQPPVVQVPEYFGDPAKSSLKYESDLVLTKRTTDILLHGHAHAPEGKPVTRLEVGFQLGPVVKVLRVYGDRHWKGGLLKSVSTPKPFIKMPLVYERAYGGVDTMAEKNAWDRRNQVGVGYATARAHVNGLALPNVEYPGQLIKKWNDRPPPAGFGPICNHWQPRVEHAGTYDDNWLQNRMPLYPADFDERYFQSAPEDQQAPRFLAGGEEVVLKNLTPGGGLRFTLPHIRLGFESFFYDGHSQQHGPPELHTVILEPDIPRVSLIWHSAFPCHDAIVAKLHYTLITQQGEPWPR